MTKSKNTSIVLSDHSPDEASGLYESVTGFFPAKWEESCLFFDLLLRKNATMPLDNATNYIELRGFVFGRQKINSEFPTVDKAFPNTQFKLRPIQKSAFDALRYSNLPCLLMPTGGGKTTVMCFIALSKMLEDDNLKCLFVVPRTVIAAGFSKPTKLFLDRKWYEWSPINLCDENEYESASKVAAVVKFLKKKTIPFRRSLTCTHATYVRAFKILEESGELKRYKNTFTWIDETQRLQADEDGVNNNEMGHIVSTLHGMGVQIGFATATPFRGDQLPIFGGCYDDLTKYAVTYEQYFESTKYLKSFSYDFVFDDLLSAVGKMAPDISKGIIFIPSVNSLAAHGVSKYVWADGIIDHFQSANGGQLVYDASTGVHSIKRNGKPDFRIINLVDEKDRAKKVAYINRIKSRDELDLIVSLNMFKEGADWAWAEEVIVLGGRNSLPDLMQIGGRVLRDVVGKPHAWMKMIFPFNLLAIEDKAQLRERVNTLLNAILVSMHFENVMNPIKMKYKNAKGETVERETNANEIPYVVNDHHTLKDEIMRDWIATSKEDETLEEKRERFDKIVFEVIMDHGFNTTPEDFAESLWTEWCRRTLSIVHGMDISDLGCDFISKVDPSNFILHYFAKCGIDTLRQVREELQRKADVRFEEFRNQMLLRIRNKQHRPKTTTEPELARRLQHYTDSNGIMFRKGFAEELNESCKDAGIELWRSTKDERFEIFRAIIMEMISAGKAPPDDKSLNATERRYASRLRNYTHPGGVRYQKGFKEEVNQACQSRGIYAWFKDDPDKAFSGLTLDIILNTP